MRTRLSHPIDRNRQNESERRTRLVFDTFVRTQDPIPEKSVSLMPPDLSDSSLLEDLLIVDGEINLSEKFLIIRDPSGYTTGLRCK